MEQQKVFVAIALSVVVLFGWYAIFPPPQPDAPTDAATSGQTSASATTPSATTAQGTSVTPSVTSTPGQVNPAKPVVKNIPQKTIAVKSERFASEITNKGGRLHAFTVLKPEQYTPRGDLVGGKKEGEAPKYLPFATTSTSSAIILPEDAMYEVVEESPKTVLLRYTDPAGLYTFDKRFTTNTERPNSFVVDLTLTNTSQQVLKDQIKLVTYDYQDPETGEWSFFNPIPDASEAVCFVDDTDERDNISDAEDNPEYKGNITWGGVTSRYFAKTIIPTNAKIVSCKHSVLEKSYVRSELTTEAFALAPGQKQAWGFITYVGPNEIETLAEFGIQLERNVDYGFLAVLCRPIRAVLVWFHDLTGNWGIAIILLTILLRALLFPINQKSYKSMEGMRKIQKPMEELRSKYENDPMKLQEEMMKLYKSEGVSPLGCLPQIFQIPIFFALYRTVYSSAELYHANFFAWYTDLSAPDPYFVLPVLVAAAMFGQQLLTPQASTNPQMKTMMYIMPLMFSVFTFVLPSGLALYIFVSVILGVAQQFYIRRNSEPHDPDAPTIEPPLKKA